MTPDYDVKVEGTSITGKLRPVLLELSVSDEAGQESDTCQLAIDDRGGVIEIPRKGAKIAIWMGYKETGLAFMGLFVVDDIEVGSSPRKMTISGRAADMTKTMKQQKTRNFENKTIGDVVKKVAGDHGFEPLVSADLASRKIPFIGQTEESDIHLMTRLAKDHGAVSKPANGKWLFVEKGTGKSASGSVLPPVIIRPEKCLSWSIKLKDRPQHKEVRGNWHDRKDSKRKTETAKGSKGSAAFGLRYDRPSQDEAKWAAEGKAKDLKASEASLSAEMVGNTSIMAGAPAKSQGLRNGLDLDWILKRADHKLSNSGFATSIEAELKP